MKKPTIKEIKKQLLTIDSVDDPFIKQCQEDERKGVQTALKQWVRSKEAEQALKVRFRKMNRYEDKAREVGYQFIAGIDEVGRGPLAGPVVASAVILDKNQPILGLNDSKKLSLTKRNDLFEEIQNKAAAIGIGIISAERIDQTNILKATKLAMIEAVEKLTIKADYLLIDAESLKIPIDQQSIIKGDMNSNSIAAASIIAKVTRDNIMTEYDKMYPGYGFDSNVGYGTKVHLEGLEKNGPTPIHRKTFAPVSNFLK